ncbi:MAG TPA: alpha/beta hydrolase, partial [Actinomycetota bacterium]|nr:alpha/beta hydrolase [Actinomycetota bacterium]
MVDVATSVLSEGVRLATEVVGEGAPVTVLAHGLTGSRADLEIFAPFLPGASVLFDFRGHGESERPGPGSYSMDHFATDVRNVAEAFGATRLAGVSLGGGATLRLLKSEPDRFERLVFIFPARLERSMTAHAHLMRLADLLERYPLEEVAERMIAQEGAMGAFDAFPASRELRRQAILRMHGDGMPHAIREALADPPVASDATSLRAVSAPALVIGQRGDPIHHADVAEKLADALPNSELVLFDHPSSLL